jgi:hypothetical protein
MGNKPAANFADNFTEHIAANPYVAYYPLDPDCGALIKFVIDQLLVGEQALGNSQVMKMLGHLAEDSKMTVFDPHQAPTENVAIWRLRVADGKQPQPDVAMAVWKLRALLAKQKIPAEQISPNHVLVPAPNFHDCPFGPPAHHGALTIPPFDSSHAIDVSVVDAGYVYKSPIAPRLASAIYAKWLAHRQPPNVPEYVWENGGEGAHPLDQNQDGKLDALVGHANFVAGIIALGCRAARIHVESDNAAFLNTGTDNPTIPTEAAVARSIWNQRSSSVINVGYAFPTLTNIELADTTPNPGGPPSLAIRVALDALDPERTYVVAPAGNQGCTVPQYPAAFWKYGNGGKGYPNVIGVGSVDANHQRSIFSNYGDWVRCCTVGRAVPSTFVAHWDGPTEDPGPQPTERFRGWASWSGTSFAAPRVAAELAKWHASGLTLDQAWQHMINPPVLAGVVPPPPSPWEHMGHRLDGLPSAP